MVLEGDCEVRLIDFPLMWSWKRFATPSFAVRYEAPQHCCFAGEHRHYAGEGGIFTPQPRRCRLLLRTKAKGSLSDYKHGLEFISHWHLLNDGSRVELKPFLDFQRTAYLPTPKPRMNVIKQEAPEPTPASPKVTSINV